MSTKNNMSESMIEIKKGAKKKLTIIRICWWPQEKRTSKLHANILNHNILQNSGSHKNLLAVLNKNCYI